MVKNMLNKSGTAKRETAVKAYPRAVPRQFGIGTKLSEYSLLVK